MIENEFTAKLRDALSDMRRLTFSRPSAEAARALGTDAAVLRAEGKRFAGSNGVQRLQLAVYTADNKVKHLNFPLDDAASRLADLLASAFSQLNVSTPRGTFEAKRAADGSPVITHKLAQLDPSAPAQSAEAHNREKNMALPEDKHAAFLTALGLADRAGRIYDKKRAKYRQINRFLEYVGDIAAELPAEGELYVLDLCCGKSYLTFAAYYYFTAVLGRGVRMTGVDLKPDVIKYCAETAASLGFTGLNFVCGDIASFEPERRPDLVLSLHACDIATDIVLAKAAQSGARVILATPCCQHELYNLFDPSDSPLEGLCAQPLIRHKLTDAFTDALRALYLEVYGYEVNAAELIDPEETPKNTLIRAIKKRAGDPSARKRYEDACAFLGARPSRLAF